MSRHRFSSGTCEQVEGGGSDTIRTVFRSLKERINWYSVDERVVLVLAISAFITIYAAAAAMLLVVVYMVKGKRLKSVVSKTPGIKYLWALCAIGVIAALINDNVVGALVAVLLAVFFLIGAFARSVMTRRLFDKVVEVSCAASLFSFAVALIQYVTYQGNMDRACSVFINANYYAAVIEIVILFAIYKLFRPGNRRQRAFYAAVIAANAAGLYFTGCRTAVFVLFAAVSLMLLLNRRYKALAVFSGSCVLFAALIVATPEILPRMAQIGDDMGTRIAIWQRALEDIVKHPVFGEGALAFRKFNFVAGGMSTPHTHSIYLEPILSFGAVGAVLILIYLKKNLSPILKMRRNKNGQGPVRTRAGVACQRGAARRCGYDGLQHPGGNFAPAGACDGGHSGKSAARACAVARISSDCPAENRNSTKPRNRLCF